MGGRWRGWGGGWGGGGGGGGGRSSKFNSFKLSSSHVYNTAHPLNPPSHFLFFSPSSVKHRDLVLGPTLVQIDRSCVDVPAGICVRSIIHTLL